MTPKSLIGLATVTVAAVALAAGVTMESGGAGVNADRGRLLLPDLAAKASEAATITVTGDKGAITLARKGDGFVDKSGYPVQLDDVRALMTSLATLTIFEDKTDKPDRYADLGLAAPGSKSGGATEIEIAGKDGASLASVFAGTKDYTVGGSRGGQYVRIGGTATSYLVRGSVDVPVQRSAWFDTRLSDIAPKSLAAVDFVARDGEKLSPAVKDGVLTLAEVAAGKAADDKKLDRLAHLFQRFDFEDVKAAPSPVASGGASVRVETSDGLALTLTEVPAEAGSGAGAWAILKAEAVKPEAADAAKAIAAKADGFAFEVGSSMAEVFGWTPASFVKDQPAAQTGDQAADPAGIAAPAN